MRGARSIDDFLRAPLGAYVQRATYLVWCAGRALCGTSVFARPTAADAATLVRIWDGIRTRLAAPYDIVTDGRGLSGVDADSFEVMNDFARRAFPLYARRVRRHAVVLAEGMAGAVVGGFFPLLGPGHRWRAFTDLGAAFAWLGRDATAALAAEVEGLLGGAPVVRALRGWLREHTADAQVGAAARALGCSARSLQRGLRAAATSFRAELARARLEVAVGLLADTDAKLGTIAARVGFASASHFSQFFRRRTGRAPGTHRGR